MVDAARDDLRGPVLADGAAWPGRSPSCCGSSRARPARAGASRSPRRTACRGACGRGRAESRARRASRPRRSGPPSRTTIRSARRTVESRCAMTSVVRPCMRLASACATSASDSESSCEVASSRIRIGRVLVDRARDGEPLSLAAGEAPGVLAEPACRSPPAGARRTRRRRRRGPRPAPSPREAPAAP